MTTIDSQQTTEISQEKTLTPQESANDTQKIIQENVDANALNLTMSALSSAMGDIKVLKLTVTNKNSLQYSIIKDDKEITEALSWIAKYGNGKMFPEKTESPTFQYFILQQSTANMSAWNSLIERNLGKVINESKINISATFDLEKMGQKALENKKRNAIDATQKVLSVPASWTTVDE